MGKNINEINKYGMPNNSKYLEFLKVNIDCEILFTDKHANLKTVKFSDYATVISQSYDIQKLLYDALLTSSSEGIYYPDTFFNNIFGTVEEIRYTPINELNGEVLFTLEVLCSAVEFIKTGIYLDPSDIRDKISHDEIKPTGDKVGLTFGNYINILICLGLVIVLITAIIKSLVD